MWKLLAKTIVAKPLPVEAPALEEAHHAELAAQLERAARARLADGPVAVPLDAAGRSGEGLGLAESFRGDVFAWVRLDGGNVARCHLRDPSWFQWPLLEAAIEGNIVADFPLCNKSFNCSYSGHDL